jgi:ribosomal protein S18 acetylase RimI-like enzyme
VKFAGNLIDWKKMNLRPAHPSDLPVLLKLEAASFETVRRDSPRSIGHGLRSPSQEIWIAEDGDNVVASMSLRFAGRVCRIHSLAVVPDWRGTGIGRRLVELARQRASDRGSRCIHLEADSRSQKLLSWYEKLGYLKTARLEDYYEPGWDAIRYRLDL